MLAVKIKWKITRAFLQLLKLLGDTRMLKSAFTFTLMPWDDVCG